MAFKKCGYLVGCPNGRGYVSRRVQNRPAFGRKTAAAAQAPAKYPFFGTIARMSASRGGPTPRLDKTLRRMTRQKFSGRRSPDPELTFVDSPALGCAAASQRGRGALGKPRFLAHQSRGGSMLFSRLFGFALALRTLPTSPHCEGQQ